MRRKKRAGVWKWFMLFVALAVVAFYLKQKFLPEVRLRDRSYVFLYIEQKDLVEDVGEKLYEEGVIKDTESFEWLAGKMRLHEKLHPGKYRITNGMNLRQIINMIRYHREEKVKLFLNSQIRDLDEFVTYVDEKLAVSEAEIEQFLSDKEQLRANFGLTPDNALALVVPGTIKVSWAVSMPALATILRERYNKLYNSARVAKARRIGFSINEVQVLASIVQSESAIASEQRKIAGVYINRLKRGMPLQADPTLKYACRNYSLQRVLNKDKQVDSPYNTYMYRGLPPGPICPVGQQAVDATLNYEKHRYLYFCARPQLDGYSNFSATYEQHRKHAVAYQKALDRRGITR